MALNALSTVAVVTGNTCMIAATFQRLGNAAEIVTVNNQSCEYLLQGLDLYLHLLQVLDLYYKELV
jgi:hypothetical protein